VPADAAEPLTVLSITRERFEELGVQDRITFPRRRAVAADHGEKNDMEVEPTQSGAKNTAKTGDEEALVRGALQQNTTLAPLLGETQLRAMIARAYKLDVPEGTVVVQEGSFSAEKFYVIASGSLNIRRREMPHFALPRRNFIPLF
jgi:hypothetical protein